MSNTVPRPLRIDPDGTFDSRYWLREEPMAQGPQGEVGPEGPVGPQGPVGEAVRIRWTVATAGELPSSDMEVGDGALVGTPGTFELYVYVNDPPAWENAGPVTAGPEGPQGPQGPQPPLAGSGSATTAAKSDHDHDGTYSPASHTHPQSEVSGLVAALAGKSPTVYAQPTGSESRFPMTILFSSGSIVVEETEFPGVARVAIRSGGHTHWAEHITSGVFSPDRIPGLNANKIAAGTLSADRVPGLNANKITAGTLAPARIPSMTLVQMFPNNATSNAGSSAMRVAPGNAHAVLGTLGAGVSFHDTSYRRTTDEVWAYVMMPNWGFCWIPANRIA